MRITVFLLFLTILQASALSSRAQYITLEKKQANLLSVINDIRDQSGYDFLISIDLSKQVKTLNVQLKHASLQIALEKCLAGQPFSFEIDENTKTVIIREKTLLDRIKDAINTNDDLQTRHALSQQIITGRVFSEDGKLLAGATVTVKPGGSTTAIYRVSTNHEGRFTLRDVPEGAKLTITYIGYVAKEVNADGNLSAIILKASAADLEEVRVNAGYYTVTDRERTGSIARVNAEEIENQPVTNVLSAVQGRMAGVNIRQIGGTAGGGFEIQIRGRNSLRTRNNSDMDGSIPLYVIDGVPIGSAVTSTYGANSLPLASIDPLNGLNLNDIESIEILKDADATAIYGSRGANGVILITTKRGKTGTIGLSVNATYGVSEAISNLKMMNTAQYLSMRKQAFANSGVTNYPATAYDINGTWDQSRNTDWQNELIGNDAAFSRVQASHSGGNELTTYLVSLGHDQQATVFSNDFKYKTNNLSGNINHRSRDNRFKLNLSNRFSLQENNVIATDVTARSFTLPPNAPALYQADGSINWENNTFDNPVAAYNATYSNENYAYLSNLTAQYEFRPGLTAKINGGINYFAFEEWKLNPNTIYNPAYITGQSSAYSQSYKSNHNRFSYILEPQLTWQVQRGSHEVDALVGGTYQLEDNSQGSMRGTGFQSNSFIKNIAAATTKTVNDQIKTSYKYAAVFGRLNYQYADRYILNVTGRRDGSSRFGPDKKFAVFGALGAAWLFDREEFLKGLSWLSSGKLRASYGSTGSDAIGDYQYLDTYTISTLIYNGITGINTSRLYNPDYSWEKTVKLESALEFGLFEDRLRINAAWYRNRSSSQLVGYQLPAITGFASVIANLNATVQNTGWEVEIEARSISGGKLQWETSMNISFPRNKLLAFPGLEGSTYANSYQIGQPITITRLYQLEGVNPQTGQYVFTDFNGDGQISSPDDRQIIKNIGITAFGGLGNSVRYKNWALSFLFQFVKQKDRNYNYSVGSPGLMINLPVELIDVWSPDNPNGVYAPYGSTANPMHSRFQISNVAVSDASFLRLKNVNLSYRIPLKRSVVKAVNVYFQGQNLLTWTSYFGIDPETGSSGFLPPMRTFSFGTQFNF